MANSRNSRRASAPPVHSTACDAVSLAADRRAAQPGGASTPRMTSTSGTATCTATIGVSIGLATCTANRSCRAGTTARFWCGDRDEDLNRVGLTSFDPIRAWVCFYESDLDFVIVVITAV